MASSLLSVGCGQSGCSDSGTCCLNPICLLARHMMRYLPWYQPLFSCSLSLWNELFSPNTTASENLKSLERMQRGTCQPLWCHSCSNISVPGHEPVCQCPCCCCRRLQFEDISVMCLWKMPNWGKTWSAPAFSGKEKQQQVYWNKCISSKFIEKDSTN